MTLRNITKRPLTDLQQTILEFIWSTGPATAEQVREAQRPLHNLKDPTVRTLLRRLEARGYLSNHVVGKVIVYRAEVPLQNVAANVVQHIIDRFCAESVEQFLEAMVDE